jgi:uncharacterized protein YjiS (DUF1127 family)
MDPFNARHLAAAHAIESIASHVPRPALSKLADAFARWVQRITKARAYRLAEYELHQLDDRTLKDIGLDRSQISYVVRHGRGRYADLGADHD